MTQFMVDQLLFERSLGSDLFLLPISTRLVCEECGSRQQLTEKFWQDEDGDSYYNVLCGSCRAEEVL